MDSTPAPTLILADSAAAAEPAMRWVEGDAHVQIDAGSPEPEAASAGDVVISGDLTNGSWVSAAFAAAQRVLGPGRRVVLLLDDRAGEAVELPDDVTEGWRLVGLTIEHPVTAVMFSPTADDDGADEVGVLFDRVQEVARLYQRRDEEFARSTGPATPTGLAGRVRRRVGRLVRSLHGR